MSVDDVNPLVVFKQYLSRHLEDFKGLCLLPPD